MEMGGEPGWTSLDPATFFQAEGFDLSNKE